MSQIYHEQYNVRTQLVQNCERYDSDFATIKYLLT